MRPVITDLATQPDVHQKIETDVLVIGAGVAGLILANRLRQKNKRVVVLESGAAKQTEETHPLNRIVQLGEAYSGATRGRFRCLGGTSTRWGGALIPFLPNDLSARPYVGLPASPVSVDALRPYLHAVEELFGVDYGSYEEDFVDEARARNYIPTGDPDFQVRFAKWPSFKKRNVALLFDEQIQSDRNLHVSINSTATEFDVNVDSGRIVSVTGRHHNGNSITVAAKNFVACAGAIETTRLLLLLDRQQGGLVFEGCKAIGHYFYDHISVCLASIHAHDVLRLNRMAGFRFVGSTMRSLRFELSPSAQKAEGVGSAFGHISFRTERDTGFDLLRNLLRSRQRGGTTPSNQLVVGALRDVPYLVRLAFWRGVHHQLLWPDPAIYELHIVAEQLPQYENCITLSSESDWFGLPLAAINWRVTAQDRTTFPVFQRLFDRFWERQGLRGIGELDWATNSGSTLIDGVSQVDVYHPGGTTRMGVDRRSAVLDENLGVFGVPNLWAASTAAFPSGGGANPTLSLMLFTLRLADHLANLC
jgi:GMC oxidoreductase/FAD binding domain